MEAITAWERDKDKLRQYSRRQPEITPLYRIVSSCRYPLEHNWETLFQHEYGALRHEVLESFDAYLNCGILAHGCARAACEDPDCNHSELIPYSCKARCLCPSCDAKRAAIFAENLVENVLLPYPHRHLVFTIPKRIRPFFKFNHDLTQHLYDAAWESWKELILEQCPTGTPAAVDALHSNGDLLAFHPHIHGIFLAGAILPDGTFQPIDVDQQRLEELFANKVLSALQKENLLSQEHLDNMKTWPHSGFNAFIGELINPADTKQLSFCARYLKKCPLSNERITIIENNGETIIEYAAYKNGAKKTRLLSPLHFLAELQQHLPNTWEQTTRFLGAYSARTRGAKNRLSTADSATVESLPEPKPKSSSSWARLMKKIFELDPLKCPRCGGPMKIKAFVTAQSEIQRLTDNLKISPQRSPPPLKVFIPEAA